MNMQHARQRGFTLLEILIAVIVLSIGLLGLAALQASSLKNSEGSLQRSVAVAAAYSLVDRIQAARTNNVQPADYATAMPMPAAVGACNLPGTGTLQGRDINDWILGVGGAGGLRQNLGPNACGGVSCAGTDCIVRVLWSDSRSIQVGAVANQMIVDVQVRFQ
jgi:type IV pilus assembly protein PilV